MQNHHIGPEATAVIQSCERLFGLIHGNGELSALEVEVLHYYARELLKHLTPFDPSLITLPPPTPSPLNDAPINQSKDF
jgi:hypothetical protein